MKLFCPECGVEFDGRQEGQCCGEECRLEHARRTARERDARRRAQEAEARDAEARIAGRGRGCVTCGKPTTDWRCPECWARIRQQNGESVTCNVGSDEWIFN